MSKIFVKIEVFAEIEIEGNGRLNDQASIVDDIKHNTEFRIISAFKVGLEGLGENFNNLTLLDGETFLANALEDDRFEAGDVKNRKTADDLDRILGVRLITTRDAISSMNILK